MGDFGYWMSSTLTNSKDHVYWFAINSGGGLYIGGDGLSNGQSVRCIKD